MSGNSCDKVLVQQVRKIGPTRRSVSGSYPFRGGQAIQYESTLERDFLIRHEFFLNVLEIIPQPVEIPFVADNGRSYTYTPDFLMSLRGPHGSTIQRVLVEVKPQALWKENWRRWSAKWKAARRFAQQQGWSFRIFDESRIRDQVLDNIRFLERYKRLSERPKQSDTLMHALRSEGPCTLPALFSCCSVAEDDQRAWTVMAWHLLAMRLIDCDTSKSLDRTTIFWVPDHE